MTTEKTAAETIEKLVKKYPSEAERIRAGVRRTAALWNVKKDGTQKEFAQFCLENFFVGKQLELLFSRFEDKLEAASGHFTALMLKLRHEMDENTGDLHPADRLFAAYSPASHFTEDLFLGKLAFMILLNFPVKTLETCLNEGARWSRGEWAKTRLAQRFSHRVPAEVNQAVAKAESEADGYIYSYNICMDKIVDPGGNPLFPKNLKLISHWGLRDYLKGLYAPAEGNFTRQKAIQTIMERIITQEIPKKVINSARFSYDPLENTVEGARAEREPDTRYERFLEVFRAHLKEDKYYPLEPTHMDRRFKLAREIPEPEAEAMFEELLEAEEGGRCAGFIKSKLARTLEPFDIWYCGFKARVEISQEELDKLVRKRWPDLDAFQSAIPEILGKLGFSKETARFVAERVEVDPARGAGHAWGPQMRTEKAHLRTRVPKSGMDYQGFNTAMHELGHCTEEVFSLYKIDHTLLEGVPNTAFTEGFAFVFQDRDLEVLGLTRPGGADLHLKALDTFWAAREIAGVALVDMNVWRWLYKNKEAEPADLRRAVIETAASVWDKYYAPLFGVKGSPILAVYSHMINNALYLPDYPLGHIIAFQIEEYFKTHNLAEDMERMCVQGSITPKEWMRRAVGESISPKPLITAAAKALRALSENADGVKTL